MFDVELYKRARADILRLQSQNKFRGMFGGAGDRLRDATNIMITGLDDLLANRRNGVSANMVERVKRATINLLDILTTRRLDKFMVVYARAYAIILEFWNMEYVMDVDLRVYASTINAILDSFLTISEAIDVLKVLLDRAEKYLGTEPPAYTLSKHFTKLILEKVEKGEIKALNES